MGTGDNTFIIHNPDTSGNFYCNVYFSLFYVSGTKNWKYLVGTGEKQAGSGHPCWFCGVISLFSWIRSHFNSVRVYLNARICCLFSVLSTLSGIRSDFNPVSLYFNARNRCLFNVIFTFSCIRSHFFPVIGGQQLNYACIGCFFSVISIFHGSGPTLTHLVPT